MALSSPGLGSGLDVKGIVSQLMTIERQPVLRLNEKEASIQAEISAYGSLKGELASLQSSLVKLKDPATFQATSASSSDVTVLDITSDSNAVKSTYSVTVDRLAQQHKLGSAEFSSTTTFGGTDGDALTLTAGADGFTLDLSTAMTLEEIQVAINGDDNQTGVTAGLITGDSGNQGLVLTAGESGYENRIQFSFAGTIDANTFDFSMLNRDADNQLLTGEDKLDASMTVDGVTVTRGSNNITDVVDGLTFELHGMGQANVSVDKNTEVARQTVQGFVTAYNNMRDKLSSLANSGVNGGVIRGLESQLQGVLNKGLSDVGDYSYISELGVTTNAETGKLELDGDQFLSALKDNPDSVMRFFTNEESGFSSTVENRIEVFLQSGGTIDSIIKNANNRVDGIVRNREALERRLEAVEDRYLKQYGALDTLMASMTTTSDYLTSQLDALSNMFNRNDN